MCVSLKGVCVCMCSMCVNLCAQEKEMSMCISVFFTVFQTHLVCLSNCPPCQMLTCKFWLQKWEDWCDTNKFSSTRQSRITPKSAVTPSLTAPAAHYHLLQSCPGSRLAQLQTCISGTGIVSITGPFTSQLTHAMKLAPCLVHNLR